jgi:hypothetical protein
MTATIRASANIRIDFIIFAGTVIRQRHGSAVLPRDFFFEEQPCAAPNAKLRFFPERNGSATPAYFHRQNPFTVTF